jgi:transposase
LQEGVHRVRQGIAKKARTTHRFKKGLAWACQHYTSLKDVTKQFRCSARLVYTAFYEQLGKWAKARAHPLPKTIGLDEHSIRKPKYKSVEFATIVVDHVGKNVYDLIDGRTLDALRADFANTLGKEQVEAVTIDMSKTYRSFVKETFPNTRVVVDRFHVERLFVKKVNKHIKKIAGFHGREPGDFTIVSHAHQRTEGTPVLISRWLNPCQAPSTSAVASVGTKRPA